jgi:hypothetical protein
MTQRRWLALCGVVAPLLVALAIFFVGGSTPDDKASAAKVVSFYRSHANASRAAALMVAIGAVLLVLFGARLRELLHGDRLGTDVFPRAAFGGAVISSAALLLAAVGHLALVTAADHRFATPAQTLNVLDSTVFFAVTGGFAVLLLSAGIATVAGPVLPRWLGWTAIVIGILALAGPIGFLGFLLGLVWILVVGILMFARDDVIAAGPVEIAEITEVTTFVAQP